MQLLLTLLFILTFPFFLIAKEINIPGDYTTIQAGIDAASDGDTILVAENTYYENINFKGKAITVTSHFILDQDTSHISKTIIDGSQHSNPDSGSVVYFVSGEDTTSILMGFTITGGTGTFQTVIPPVGSPFESRSGGGIYATPERGAIICWNIIENNQITTDKLALGGGITAGAPDQNPFMIIENNIIRNNSISGELTYVSGGAIFMGSNGRIKDNSITNNLCHSVNNGVAGGAIRFLNVEEVSGSKACLIENNSIFDNLAVSENSYSFGGGVFSAGIRMVLRNNRILSNIARGNFEYAAGGGVYIGALINGQHLIENNLFYGNEQDGGFYGGGLGVFGGSPLVRNNIFSDNSSGYGGGFFQDNSASSQLVNNTFYKNSAANQGGAIYSRNSALNVINSIIWDNTAPTGQQIYRTGGSVTIVFSDVQGGWEGMGNIASDPLFTDTLFHLSDSSRCIGAGSIVDAPANDFDGNVRPDPAGSRPDMGALENPRAYPLLPVIQIPEDYATIQAGLDAAENGDTVLVAEGTYYENVTIQSKAITLASYFLIDGDTSHISRTIINGSQPINTDNASVIMILNTPSPNTICGFTLTGGLGMKKVFPDGAFSQIGGGIDIEESSAIIKNNHIINNSIISTAQALGTLGGGIFWGAGVVSGLTLEISGNLISGNEITGKMTGGAGINISNYIKGGELDYLIEENIIKSNTVFNSLDNWKAMGGGIFLDFSLPTSGNQIIRNNIISDNSVICEHSFGGGLYFAILDSEPGGTIDNDPGPFIYNNIISGNHSDYLGGGVSVWRVNKTPYDRAIPLTSAGRYTPKPSFINNTIVNNTAQDGSGFYIMNHKPFLMNNILWNDHPQNAVWGEIFLGDEPQWTAWVEPNTYGGAEIYYTDIQGGWDDGAGNRNEEPLFVDAENGDFHLLEGSPGIGWGMDSSIVPKTDFYGNIRPHTIDDSVDMGAIESPFLTDIADENNLLPVIFELKQNYPNPFNPKTTIEYDLSKTSQVDLSIYNLLGQKVATLVDIKQLAGSYQVQWDATVFASGIYLYKLTTNNGFFKTRKLIILK